MSNFKILRTSIPIFTIGDSTTGKTSIISVYSGNPFQQNMTSTIGIDYFVKSITLPNGKNCSLKLWDTAGQECYRSVALKNVKVSMGIILVYDITSNKSFKNIKNWINEISNTININEIPLLFLGNKTDLQKERDVETEEGEKLADEYKGLFFETSAKKNKNLDNAFKALIDKIYEKNINQFNIDNNNNKEIIQNNDDIQSNQNQNINLNTEQLKKHKSSSKKKYFC